jgi:UDP-N-acetyl-D-galactosamine dehydrogenase
MEKHQISVTGLGYVGLPVSVAFSEAGYNVIGLDLNEERVKELNSNFDKTNEISRDRLSKCNINFTITPSKIAKADFHIVTVPTPIDKYNKPDFKYIILASKQLGKIIKKGDIVVYESTVYPGATEEIAIPILEDVSGMKINEGFSVGYSPERINPADPVHTFENNKKVVSASNSNALETMIKVYGDVVKAGVYPASSIKVAEAAKVIENSQRDLNIAFMNELVKIFNAMGIDTNEVLDVASTKWNFINFRPGLVGGHCIGVDPYYLIHKSQQVGIIPDLLISSRKINDGMSGFYANKVQNILKNKKIDLVDAKILMLGVTFKEDCPDTRNSKVFNLIDEIKVFGSKVDIFDPIANIKDISKDYKQNIIDRPKENSYDLIVIAVGHNMFKKLGGDKMRVWCKSNGMILDLKNTIPKFETDYIL